MRGALIAAFEGVASDQDSEAAHTSKKMIDVTVGVLLTNLLDRLAATCRVERELWLALGGTARCAKTPGVGRLSCSNGVYSNRQPRTGREPSVGLVLRNTSRFKAGQSQKLSNKKCCPELGWSGLPLRSCFALNFVQGVQE